MEKGDFLDEVHVRILRVTEDLRAIQQTLNCAAMQAPGDPELRLNPDDEGEVVKTTVVREVVRINHHRNCLLCHPPADTGSKIEGQQLSTLPLLNNRNYQNTLMLVPGVQRTYRSNSPFFNSQEHLQSVVNGLDQKNNYMIEFFNFFHFDLVYG
jgi:hypothetical protein